MFYNGLTSLDGKLAPQPALAESWETPDATNWTFKLRQGVTFHDGKALDAADVVYSLTRHKDPAVASRARSLAEPMAEVKAVAPDEVRITLSAPNADLPVVLGTFHFLVVKDGTTDFTTAVGTGPYRCKEFTPGVRSVAVRNENYWKQGRPYLDEIEFIGIPRRAGAGERAAVGRHPSHRRHQPALRAPHLADAGLRGVRDQVGLLHRPRHPPGQRAGQQPGLRPRR